MIFSSRMVTMGPLLSDRRTPASACADAGAGGPPSSDVKGAQRSEAVEGYRCVGRGVGPGAFDQHLVADLEADRQIIGALLVQHVGGVAGRACEHARSDLVAVMRRLDRVADRLAHRLGEA